ncbi:irp2 [Klebsiella pneumoniae]|nr:irp2 [Klebsiella pneumoniae]
MISGAPSQDSLLPDNRHAADYQQLRERLIQELNLTPQQLHEESNLIQAGLDSIRLMRWLHWFRKNGYRLTLRELYAAPTLAAWNQLMLSRSPENAEEETPPDEFILAEHDRKYPLPIDASTARLPDGPHAGAEAWRRGLPPVSGV